MVIKLSVLRSDFIGVYLRVAEDIVFAPPSIEDESLEALVKELGVTPILTLVNQTNLVGSLTTINSNGMILPVSYDTDMIPEIPGNRNILFLKEKINAIGNDIVTNDHGAMVHKGFTQSAVKKIEDALGVEVVKGLIGEVKTVGSVSVVTSKGMIVTPDTTEEERKELSAFFKVPVKDATANFGSMYVGSSVVANSKGVVVGNSSTP
ncbi:MAG: translation initiation factor IF-6, partial [Candidatus Thermoplasmatota archaeon]|nr:translation initiation factor IF-6 [Candidatus Thermoplasmatota archaeon]